MVVSSPSLHYKQQFSTFGTAAVFYYLKISRASNVREFEDIWENFLRSFWCWFDMDLTSVFIFCSCVWCMLLTAVTAVPLSKQQHSKTIDKHQDSSPIDATNTEVEPSHKNPEDNAALLQDILTSVKDIVPKINASADDVPVKHLLKRRRGRRRRGFGYRTTCIPKKKQMCQIFTVNGITKPYCLTVDTTECTALDWTLCSWQKWM